MQAPDAKQDLNQLTLSQRRLLSRDTLAASYIEARTEYEHLSDLANDAKKHFDSVSAQLAQLMEEIGDDHFFKDGLQLGTRRHFGVSVTQENSDSWRAWLSDKFGDDSPYLKEVVDKSVLQEDIKSKLESGELHQDDVPEWANLKTQPIITVKGWKK